jgi:hypothetical protein
VLECRDGLTETDRVLEGEPDWCSSYSLASCLFSSDGDYSRFTSHSNCNAELASRVQSQHLLSRVAAQRFYALRLHFTDANPDLADDVALVDR